MNKKDFLDFKFLNLVIGFLAAAMIFLPVLILKDTETFFTGLEISFGSEFASLGSLASGEIAFNPLVLLAFVLPLIGALIPLFTSKGYLVSTVLYVIAAFLVFMIPEFTTVTVTVLGNANEIDVEWTYGIGLMFAAALSIVGAVLGFYRFNKAK